MDGKVRQIINILQQEFPSAKSELVFSTPYQLLIAVILSAQCTDKRVNQVTKQLFAVAATPQEMVTLTVEQIEQLIHSCGFYHNKARFLLSASQDIITRFNGEVPSTLGELVTLAGVGRKTANVVYSVAYKGQAIAVDTHVFRVSNRLGIAEGTTPLEVEKGLMRNIESELWGDSHHYLLLHGRYVCTSRSPHCDKCSLTPYCKHYKQTHGE